MILSKRLQAVKPSPTLAITAKAMELKAAGHDIVSLSAGEPDYDTPDHIKTAAKIAIDEGKTKYTPVEGIKQLKDAICAKFERENGISYKPNEIIVGAGAKQVLFNALLATISAGDEVIVLAPYWVSYVDMVELAEGKSVIVHCKEENGFKPRASEIEKAITPATKWLIINSPNNPTGATYNWEELVEIAEVLRKHPNVYVMTDDIYEHIIFDDHKFCTLAQVDPSLKSRILTINGMSKSYAMTGWRVGYGAGPKEIIDAMSIIQSQSTSNACSISQYAALAALNGPQDCIAEGRDLFERRRNMVLDLVNNIDGLSCKKPSGAFYLLINCSSFIGSSGRVGDGVGSKVEDKMVGKEENMVERRAVAARAILSSDDFCSYLLEKALVAAVPGEAFGAPGYIRISCATSEALLKEACDRMKKTCFDLRQ